MSDDAIPFRRPTRTGHRCTCGSRWSPGFSSDPAWLITADPGWSMFEGVLSCSGCGRAKVDVLREQAEARRAATPPAIPPRDRPPAKVIPFQRPARTAARTEDDQP